MRTVALCLALALARAAEAVPPAQPARPIAVSGAVFSLAGAPLSGVHVELIPLPSQYDWALGALGGSEPAAVTQARTDRGGRFTLQAPYAGVWAVEASAEGFVPLRCAPVPVVEPRELPPARLAASDPVAVRVVDAAGAPVAGAWVLAEAAAPELWSESVAQGWRPAGRLVRSDQRGGALLPRAVSEPLRVSAFARGGAARQERVTGPATLALSTATANVSIEVRDASGQPVAELLVAAGDPPWPVGLTGDDGALTVPGDPALPLRLLLFAKDGRRQSVEAAPAEGARRVELHPAATVVVRALAAQDRRPLAGALLVPVHDPGRATWTDGRGEARIVAPAERLEVQARAPGRLPAAAGLRLEGDAVRRGLTVQLREAARLAGRVVDEGGRPVAGATVTAQRAAPEPGRLDLESAANDAAKSVRTDDQGAFLLTELSPGRIQVSAHARGRLPASRTLDVPASAPVELVVGTGAVIEGSVTGGDGSPVAGARLAVGQATATSDGAGFFRLAGVPTGMQTLAVRHPGYRHRFERLAVEPGSQRVDVTLQAGHRVAGWVRDDAGSAISGARVFLKGRSAGEDRDYATESGPGGRFELPAVASGAYRVEAAKKGWAASRRDGELLVHEPVDGVDVVLGEAFSVTGRLLGLSRDDLAAVRVLAVAADREDHRASLSPDGSYRVEDLGAGDWTVRAEVPGGRRRTEARVRLEGEARTVVRDLRFGGLTLTGLVSHGGEPLADSLVAVEGRSVSVDRSVRTDLAGAFRLDDLEPGTYRLHVANPRELLTYNLDLEIAADLDLPLDIPTAAVSGRILSAATSRPLAEALVSFQRLLGDGAPPGSITALSTGPEGTFAVERLTAGRYRLTVNRDGYTPAERQIELVPGADLDALDLRLTPAAGLVLRVRSTAGPVFGPVTLTVLDPSGRPVLTETRAVSADGVLRFPTVPPGDWQLRVAAAGTASAAATATIPGDPVEVELAQAARLEVRIAELVETSLVASATLLAPDGSVLQTVDPVDGLRDRWSLPAGTGMIAGVPAGTWTLRAVAPDGRTWEGTVTVVGAGEVAVILE